MGRIFEVRKAAMFARYDKMAKQFTRIGKEIVIAVKANGPDPDTNAALRRCYQNAKYGCLHQFQRPHRQSRKGEQIGPSRQALHSSAT